MKTKNIEECLDEIWMEMRKLKIPQYKMALMLGVSVSTLIRYFKQETDMKLKTYLKILRILERASR